MNAAARLVEVRVPDMGNFKDVAIIDILVKPGEKIEIVIRNQAVEAETVATPFYRRSKES